jgi:hypothetical protein
MTAKKLTDAETTANNQNNCNNAETAAKNDYGSFRFTYFARRRYL